MLDERGARALASLDQFAVAVAYLNGWLDVEGDMTAALSMRDFFRDFRPVFFLSRFVPSLLGRGISADSKDISAHYDRETEFFLTFLDTRHRCYTQGYFERDDVSLEDAMTRKLDIAIEMLGVRPGDHVLEVGGGRGAFLEYAGRRGIKVTSLTLARESERYLRRLIDEQRLPATVVRQHLLRYTSERRYDAIVNMGTTEHLPDYRATVRKYAELLAPGGRVYLDALAMTSKFRMSSFMSRYIYPGKSSPLLLHRYLHTVAREEIVTRWGEQLYRQFRLFLWGSADAFATGRVQAYRWGLQLP